LIYSYYFEVESSLGLRYGGEGGFFMAPRVNGVVIWGENGAIFDPLETLDFIRVLKTENIYGIDEICRERIENGTGKGLHFWGDFED